LLFLIVLGFSSVDYCLPMLDIDRWLMLI
jgi:hypothetical protein